MPMIGDCPYKCGHTAMRLVPGEEGGAPSRPLPVFSKEPCEGCGKIVWVKYSRWDPEVWTEEDFHAAFEVNEEAKSIKDRPKVPT